MLTGSDVLVERGLYTINQFGTRKVWTHEGSDIYLRDHKPGDKKQVNKSLGTVFLVFNTHYRYLQIFRATVDDNKRFGLVCMESNVRVGRNRNENLRCNSSFDDNGSWEALHFWRAPKGGYHLMMTKDPIIGEPRFCPLKITSDSYGEYLMMVAETDDTWGLTRVGTNDVLFWIPPTN